jgi:hypothetical protein
MVIITGLKKSLILQQVSLHMILQTNGERLQQNMALLKTLGPNHGREYYLYKETLLENAKETNSNTPLVRELYAPFATNTMEVDSKRAINCKGAKREGHSDLIICNYKL